MPEPELKATHALFHHPLKGIKSGINEWTYDEELRPGVVVLHVLVCPPAQEGVGRHLLDEARVAVRAGEFLEEKVLKIFFNSRLQIGKVNEVEISEGEKGRLTADTLLMLRLHSWQKKPRPGPATWLRLPEFSGSSDMFEMTER